MVYLRATVHFRSGGNTNCPKISNRNITTLQEYILEDYAAQVRPDILLLGSSAWNAKLNLSTWFEQETWLMKQVIQSVHRATRIFWFSHMAYCDEKQDEEHARIRINDSGHMYTIGQNIQTKYTISKTFQCYFAK